MLGYNTFFQREIPCHAWTMPYLEHDRVLSTDSLIPFFGGRNRKSETITTTVQKAKIKFGIPLYNDITFCIPQLS
jgi:hypothetical protein